MQQLTLREIHPTHLFQRAIEEYFSYPPLKKEGRGDFYWICPKNTNKSIKSGKSQFRQPLTFSKNTI
ncbi:MAG: hypothetical protein HW421_3872 [Ignavibacteria bacterium]|nr:hypothetical protein [Ignavibacteria bacterium]